MPLRACRPRLTASQGGSESKACAVRTRQSEKRATALLEGALQARALPTPLRSGRRAKEKRRVARMEASQFGVRPGCPVDKPRSPAANLQGRRPGRRGSGVAFSIGPFLLATQEKGTRPPQEGETLFSQRTTQKSTPHLNPSQSLPSLALPPASMQSSPQQGEEAEACAARILIAQPPESFRSAPATPSARSGAPKCRRSRPPRSPACPRR